MKGKGSPGRGASGRNKPKEEILQRGASEWDSPRQGASGQRSSTRSSEQRPPERAETGRTASKTATGKTSSSRAETSRNTGGKLTFQTPRQKTPSDPTAILRLNKFLADAGVCSRRDADEFIARGDVRVNGRIVTELGTKVHLSDLVTVQGEPINAEKHLTYIILNKPKDHITTMSDEKGRKTVMDLLPENFDHRVYPVGRLDRNTTGVLLMTNDGDLAHRLTHPSYEIPRVYSVGLDKRLLPLHAQKIASGIEIETETETYTTAPCSIFIDPQDGKHITLEIHEGKNREIRRIFESLGYEVEKLDRKAYATITTRGLLRGEYRHLTRNEILDLERAVGIEDRLEEATTDRRGRSGSKVGSKTGAAKTGAAKAPSRLVSATKSASRVVPSKTGTSKPRPSGASTAAGGRKNVKKR